MIVDLHPVNMPRVVEHKPYVDPRFPTWRYHPVHGGRVVKDERELCALGDGWYDSPNFTGEPTGQPAVSASSEPAIPTADGPVPVLGLTAEAAKSVHSSPVKTIVETIEAVEDVTLIAHLRDAEKLNPKVIGGRPTIIQAAEERLWELAKAKSE